MNKNPPKRPIAIVTGGGQGIGRAIALRLAHDGSNIVIASRNISNHTSTLSEIKEIGVEATSIQTDISSEASVKQMLEKVMAKYGRVDCLINNAGFYESTDLLNSNTRDWMNVIETDLFGALYTSRAVAAAMIENSIEGCIVNISSIQSIRADPGSSAYCVAKGGIDQLTRSLAVDLAKFRIRVNAVAPGFINTTLWGDIASPDNYLNTDGFKQQYIEGGRIPLARIGAPDDIAGVVAFLVSKDSQYMTGQILVVDGGLTLTF